MGILASILDSGKQDIYTYEEIFGIVGRKVQTLEEFFERMPGFGGYMPWVYQNGSRIVPTNDFLDKTPALDNAELFWAAVALSHAWEQKHPDAYPELRERWSNITWKLMLKNARKIFFNETTGKIRAVASMNSSSLSVE